MLSFSDGGVECTLHLGTSERRTTGFSWKTKKYTDTDSSGETLRMKSSGYANARVNIGHKPAGSVVKLATHETANLPPFTHLKEECQVVHKASYVGEHSNFS